MLDVIFLVSWNGYDDGQRVSLPTAEAQRLILAGICALDDAQPSQPTGPGVVPGAGNSPGRQFISTAVTPGVSQSIVLIGDSTGNETSEWFYLWLQSFIAKLPAGTFVRYRLYDDANGRYGVPTILAGAENEPGVTVGADLRGWGLLQSAIGTIGGADLDLRVDCALTSYTGVAEQNLLSQFGLSGSRAWRFYINTSGLLYLNWSTTGSDSLQAFSTAALPFAAGQRGWIRATLDVDDGASGNTVTFFTSTDGVTWTQLGSAVTAAGVTSVFNAATQPIEIGSRGGVPAFASGGASAGSPGAFYGASLARVINGPNLLPSSVHAFTATNGMNGTRIGGPSIEIFNGSIPGSNLTDMTTGDRLARIVPRDYGPLVILSSSHNEGATFDPATLTARLESALTLINARATAPRYVVNTQNPQTSPRTVQQIDAQMQRAAYWRQTAAARNWLCIDAFGRVAWVPGTSINTDGVHPLQPGSQAWADEAAAVLG